jgi:hypothetical protein
VNFAFQKFPAVIVCSEVTVKSKWTFLSEKLGLRQRV